MRILVTSAAEFVGSHVAYGVLFERNEVLGVDNFLEHLSPNFKHKIEGFLCDSFRDQHNDLDFSDLIQTQKIGA